MTHQYSMRDTLEISGIPMRIDDDKQLEEEVVEIFKDAKATVNRQNIKKMDIQAAHRHGVLYTWRGHSFCIVTTRDPFAIFQFHN